MLSRCYYLLLALLLSQTVFAANPPAQRVIALAPHLTEQVYALGAGDKLVAAVEYSDYPEAAKALPRLGNAQYINLEAILAFEPDLVLIWPQGVQLNLAEQLASFGIATYLSEAKDLYALPDNLRELSQTLGVSEQGDALASDLEQRFADLKRQATSRKPISVFYQLSDQPLMSISASSWINEGLKLCALENILSDAKAAYPLVDVETVVAADPQLILLAGPDAGWNQWPQMRAVQDGALLELEVDRLHRLTPRTLDGIEQLCEMTDAYR